jgi:UDP-N-acetylglucosamine 2-epimerase (non-hydrolysing)
MRVMFVFGTRPEAIKLFPLIHAAQRVPEWTVQVCVTAQHRQMLDQVLRIAGISPDVDLNMMRPNQELADITSAVLLGVQGAIDRLSPDIVVVQGDTTTAFAGALAAFYRHKPIAHVEAGLRSGDLEAPFPEEGNRRFVTQVARYHFAPTRSAADNLAREGVPTGQVFVTGNTVIDALRWMRARLSQSSELATEVARDLPQRMPGRRRVLVTAHRRENFDGGIERIARAVGRLAARGDVEVLFPVHLNPNVRGPVEAILGGVDGVRLLSPLDYLPFVYLLGDSDLIITDSGGVQEEAPAFGVPVLVTREVTERPEGVRAGTARLVGSDEDLIVAEACRLLDDAASYAAMSKAHNPFGDGHASERVIAALSGAPVAAWES